MASLLIILSKEIIDMLSKLDDDLTKRKPNNNEITNENLNEDNDKDNDENKTLVNESVLYYEPSKLTRPLTMQSKNFSLTIKNR